MPSSTLGNTIGVVHRPPRLFQVETLADYFGEPVGAVVHGHTHRSHIMQMGDVLCMNPGSPTTLRDGARSVILLEATDGLRPRIHVLPGPEEIRSAAETTRSAQGAGWSTRNDSVCGALGYLPGYYRSCAVGFRGCGHGTVGRHERVR